MVPKPDKEALRCPTHLILVAQSSLSSLSLLFEIYFTLLYFTEHTSYAAKPYSAIMAAAFLMYPVNSFSSPRFHFHDVIFGWTRPKKEYGLNIM